MKKRQIFGLVGITILVLIGILATSYTKPFSYISEGVTGYSNQICGEIGIFCPEGILLHYEQINGLFQGVMLWLILIGICILIYQISNKE